MASFITDADLLAYEPNLFIDLPFASQQRLRVTDAQIADRTLTSATGGFDGLVAGQIIILGAAPATPIAVAIASVDSDTQLTLAAAPVGLEATVDLPAVARTLDPQIQLVHTELMRALGLDPDRPDSTLDESAVISVGTVRHIEALGVLWLAYNAAAALAGDNRTVAAKAEHYRLRYRAALNSTAVLLDTDGDGQADLWRRPGVMSLIRQ